VHFNSKSMFRSFCDTTREILSLSLSLRTREREGFDFLLRVELTLIDKNVHMDMKMKKWSLLVRDRRKCYRRNYSLSIKVRWGWCMGENTCQRDSHRPWNTFNERANSCHHFQLWTSHDLFYDIYAQYLKSKLWMTWEGRIPISSTTLGQSWSRGALSRIFLPRTLYFGNTGRLQSFTMLQGEESGNYTNCSSNENYKQSV